MEDCRVSSLEELVQWNKDHASDELPLGMKLGNHFASDSRKLDLTDCQSEWPGQDLLVGSLEDTTPLEKVERARVAVKELAKGGLDKVLDDYELEAIIAPTDSPIYSLASSAGKLDLILVMLLYSYFISLGYPIATVPLGRRMTNGRPFGASIVAKANREDILIKIMSAWEATFPKREIPTLVVNQTSKF